MSISELLEELSYLNLSWLQILEDFSPMLPLMRGRKITLVVPSNEMFEKWVKKSPTIRGLVAQMGNIEEGLQVPDVLLCSVGSMLNRGRFQTLIADFAVDSNYVDGTLAIKDIVKTKFGDCVIIGGILSTPEITQKLIEDANNLPPRIQSYWSSLDVGTFWDLILLGDIRDTDLFALCISASEINVMCNAHNQGIFRKLLVKQYELPEAYVNLLKNPRATYFQLMISGITRSGTAKYICNTQNVNKPVTKAGAAMPLPTYSVSNAFTTPMRILLKAHRKNTILMMGSSRTYDFLGIPADQRRDGKSFLRFPDGAQVRSISVCNSAIIAADANGDLWGIGESLGQYSPPITQKHRFQPLERPSGSMFVKNPYFRNVKQVSCGHGFFGFIMDDAAWVSGIKTSNNPKEVAEKYPKPIQRVSAVKISCGGGHVLILDKDGNVWTFGNNYYHQLGRISYEGKERADDYERRGAYISAKIVSIVAGYDTSFAIDEGSRLWVCGNHSDGQLGFGKSSGTWKKGPRDFFVKEFALAPIPVKVRMVSAGISHSAVIDEKLHLWTTGKNSCGQLCREGPDSWSFQKVSDERYVSLTCAGNETYLMGKSMM